ncbi:YoaK family protein [Sellimonas caecigallum]|uniref:DUF1275 domain-containing protein n=1 Tax=Sellimonas caecigallum TaxID=2592333 RepID=A0ABS7L384_9FIRM|nr:DUF1275 domain-containing protein [Sellimonas caecigallum]
MLREKKCDVAVHYIMACCGGFIGAYAILSRMEVFGSAQTANLIELVCDILGRNPKEIMIRICALLIYVGAMILSVVLEKTTSWNLKYPAIVFDLTAVTAVGFVPGTTNPIIALYPVFFATAFQWCVFKGANGYVSSTIFSTNNLKQTVISATDYLMSAHDEEGREKKAEKALFFGGTILSFHAGVAVSYLLWLHYGIHASWFCVVPLVFGGVLVAAGDGIFSGSKEREAEAGEIGIR